VIAAGVAALWQRRPAPAPAAAAPDPDIEGYDEAAAESWPQPSFSEHAAPFLARHCGGCHSRERARGGVVLDAGAAPGPALWRRVAAAVESGRMPPAGRPRPRQAEADLFGAWLADALSRDGGADRANVRRLNRSEYNNTIRDLVGVSFRPAADFPPDDTGDGFDTSAGALSVSPTLIERYLLAAETVVESAAGDPLLWRRLRTPPAEDYVPFVLRGDPPRRNNAVKGQLQVPADGQTAFRAAEIDRTYAVLQAFADRAYRRPITHAEMYRLMRFVEAALNGGEEADAGLKLALKAVLVSPHFLFRVEADPDRQTGNFGLAARLSYFLWSSMPDEELFRLAARRQLCDARVLVRQVRRMLRDHRSRALAENFGGQWLQTRALAQSAPDPALFPRFDNDLRAAMREETERLLDFLVREDRSALELLTADFTFVNERLARHYGIPGVRGEEFRRVSLAGTPRAGAITHASVLTVTSGPTRTSPVKRGRWVLENVLGSAVPPPPPGADDLKAPGATAETLRERLERHRSRAECASCHARMDPLGYALENFDAVGAWRDRDGEMRIDPTGTLPDGRRFRGVAELRAILAERPERFARCLAEKLLVYALGRGLTPADRPAVNRIVRHAGRNGYRISSLVIALVRSDLFQKRNARPGGAP
jgi:mono/diheme cytochrome c family protein